MAKAPPRFSAGRRRGSPPRGPSRSRAPSADKRRRELSLSSVELLHVPDAGVDRRVADALLPRSQMLDEALRLVDRDDPSRSR